MNNRLARDPFTALLPPGLVLRPDRAGVRVGVQDVLNLRLVENEYRVVASVVDRSEEPGERLDALVKVLGALRPGRRRRQIEAFVPLGLASLIARLFATPAARSDRRSSPTACQFASLKRRVAVEVCTFSTAACYSLRSWRTMISSPRFTSKPKGLFAANFSLMFTNRIVRPSALMTATFSRSSPSLS
jgi:hypothetical protein